jgi:hypothetical protein
MNIIHKYVVACFPSKPKIQLVCFFFVWSVVSWNGAIYHSETNFP